MKDSTKKKLREILERQLGRPATDDEIANAETDSNLIATLNLEMNEEMEERHAMDVQDMRKKINIVDLKASKKI